LTRFWLIFLAQRFDGIVFFAGFPNVAGFYPVLSLFSAHGQHASYYAADAHVCTAGTSRDIVVSCGQVRGVVAVIIAKGFSTSDRFEC
jgi:hypothetical protein